MSSIASPLAAPRANVGRSFSAYKQTTGLKIVVSAQSAINALLLTYVALTPLLVIPVAGLLGASDVLFFPTLLAIIFLGRQRTLTTSHLLLAIFLMLAGLSLYQTRELAYVAKWGRLIGILLPFFLASFATVTLRQIVRVFFWSGLFAIIMGVAIWYFDVVVFTNEANQRIWAASGESRLRASGLFGNSGAFGALVAMWTVACGLFAITEKRPNKLVLGMVIATAILALLASTSRASLLSIVAGFGAASCVSLMVKLKRREIRLSGSTISLGLIAIVVVMATLCFVAPQLMDDEWFEVTLSRFDPFSHQSSDNFLSGRVTIWQEYLGAIHQWGALGVGYKQGPLHFAISPHNQFLSLAAETGIPSLFVFVLLLITVVRTAIRQLSVKPVDSMMCIAILSAFVADGMGGEPLGSWQVTPVTMILIGICISRVSQGQPFREHNSVSPRPASIPV